MPMVDVYGRAGTFSDTHQLAVDLAKTLMTIEGVPDIPIFRQCTVAFVDKLPGDGLRNVDGDNVRNTQRRWRLDIRRQHQRGG
jgi:hypothetical protein